MSSRPSWWPSRGPPMDEPDEPPSRYLAWYRNGYPKLPFHPDDLTWKTRIWLRVNNDIDFNVDYHEVGRYLHPDNPYLFPPVLPKYIPFPERRKWYLKKFIDADWEAFLKYVEDEEEWIIVEPYYVGDKAGRWISVGNFFHKTALWGAVISFLICFNFPNRKLVYWPFTYASVCSMIGYYYFMRDPINKYQIEWNLRELSRFPMHLFFQTPIVFRKTPNLGRRIVHRIVAIAGLAYSLWYLPAYAPCGCAYGLDEIKEFYPPQFWHFWKEIIPFYDANLNG